MPGRHASPAKPRFYRDLLTMVGGILLVAIIAYLGMDAFFGTQTSGSIDTTAAVAATTAAVTTTTGATTTSTTASLTTTTGTTTTAATLRDPTEIQVRVLNGVGTAGLAAAVSAELQGLGYQMLDPGDYSPTLDQSRVWYSEGFEGEAFELAAEFPDAQVEQANAEIDAEADIVVVLGESYES